MSFAKEASTTAKPSAVHLERFSADWPNRRWAADFTYIWATEGWLYVAVVIDLFSRRVVGWSMKNRMKADLVTDALMMAIWRRGPADKLLHHSDSENMLAGSFWWSDRFNVRHSRVCGAGRPRVA